MSIVKRFLKEEDGADATEYALLAALIAVAVIGGAATLGGSIGNLFEALGGRVGGQVANVGN